MKEITFDSRHGEIGTVKEVGDNLVCNGQSITKKQFEEMGPVGFFAWIAKASKGS